MELVEELIGGSEQSLVLCDRDATRVIILNRPAKRNALTVEMRRGFAAAMAAACADERIKAIIVTGAGGVFSAGLDTSEPRDPNVPVAVRPHPGEAARMATKPVIAAVDGPCVTGGLELALSCSFIVASDRARFADTHARIGAFPSWGQSALLPRAIGVRRARQMVVSGQFIDAATALNWGLVNECVAAEALVSRALDIATSIAGCNAESVRRQLNAMDRGDGVPMARALALGEEEAARWIRDFPFKQ